jgi:hypothetical protein
MWLSWMSSPEAACTRWLEVAEQTERAAQVSCLAARYDCQLYSAKFVRSAVAALPVATLRRTEPVDSNAAVPVGEALPLNSRSLPLCGHPGRQGSDGTAGRAQVAVGIAAPSQTARRQKRNAYHQANVELHGISEAD